MLCGGCRVPSYARRSSLDTHPQLSIPILFVNTLTFSVACCSAGPLRFFETVHITPGQHTPSLPHSQLISDSHVSTYIYAYSRKQGNLGTNSACPGLHTTGAGWASLPHLASEGLVRLVGRGSYPVSLRYLSSSVPKTRPAKLYGGGSSYAPPLDGRSKRTESPWGFPQAFGAFGDSYTDPTPQADQPASPLVSWADHPAQVT